MVFSGIVSRPARIAILGPGGYGKTTLANAVLTHGRIREHFGDARHFIPCESIFSSEALLIELGRTLGVLDGPPNALWPRIRTVLSTGESILCLDNFESPWDQSNEIKHSVEELLSRITVLQVTILITMRGAERPARTQWSQPFLEPLDTLGHAAAEQVWQAIGGNYDEYAEKLTAAVDYVPLAVDLLAHLSQMTPPVLLWEEWNSKWTKMIRMGQMHRLSNLEYSIQLSIDSQRMKANPSAKSLLGVLSMLPVGLHMMQMKTFQDILLNVDIISCLRTLQQCSLIKLTDERYQLHPIVRHVCIDQSLLSQAHKATLENFYISLASDAYNPPSPKAHTEIVLEVNNIKAVLLDLLNSNYKNLPKLVNASINFTWFLSRTGHHSDKLMSQAVDFIQKNHGAISLLIDCLSTWGLVYYGARKIEPAQEKLKEAEKLCKSSFNVGSLLYGNVLMWLGDTYWLQDALDDSMASYQSALKIYKRKKNIIGQGYIFAVLGHIYIRLGQWDKAIISQQHALQLHKHSGDHFEVNLNQGMAHQGLGEVYIRQSRLVEAEAEIQKALELYKTINSTLAQGNAYLSLGRLYLQLKQPDNAIVACQKAIELHIALNDPLNEGYDHCEIGNCHLFQGKLDEAENSYMTALELHKIAKSVWGQGNDYYGLGRLFVERQQMKKAQGMFEEAIVFHGKSQDKIAEQKDKEDLSKLLLHFEMVEY